MGRLRRFARETRGASVIVETVFAFLILMGITGFFASYGLATHARSVVIQAAAAGGRTASIECGATGDPNKTYQDVVSVVQQTLRSGLLTLTQQGDPSSGRPGVWQVTMSPFSCTSGSIQVTVSYNQLNIFPPAGPIISGDPQVGWSFRLSSGAVFPVE